MSRSDVFSAKIFFKIPKFNTKHSFYSFKRCQLVSRPLLSSHTNHTTDSCANTPTTTYFGSHYYGDDFWMAHYNALVKLCPCFPINSRQSIDCGEISQYLKSIKGKGSAYDGCRKNFNQQMKHIAKFAKPIDGKGTDGVIRNRFRERKSVDGKASD